MKEANVMPLTVNVVGRETYNSETNEFSHDYHGYLIIEHSLASIHSWEQKYHRAFMNNKREKTNDEYLDYIRMMTISCSDPDVYEHLSIQDILEIKKYIDDPMTATYFHEDDKKDTETITSELVYYWMIQSGIPFECEKWHINSLLSLIKVCSIKNSKASGKKGRKLTGSEIEQRRALNARRMAEHGSKG